MKDTYQIFDEGLQRIAKTDSIGFENCFRIAADLIRVATYSDFKQGVLVAEVLEDIFNQVGLLFERYDIPENDKTYIKDKIGDGVSMLSSAYRNDHNKAYEILADLRFAATKFQFKCFTTWRRLPRQPRAASGGGV